MNGLLLDTHVVLWWLEDNPALSDDVKDTIDIQRSIYVSAVVPWEITIKQSVGKLEGPSGLQQAVNDRGFRELPVTFEHAMGVGLLPHHHKDPFDRLLIAQARHEQLTLVTHDEKINWYEVTTLVV